MGLHFDALCLFKVIILVKLSALVAESKTVMNYKCFQWSKEYDLNPGVAVSLGLTKNVDLGDK